MKNFVSTVRARVRQPEFSMRNVIKAAAKLYVVAAVTMFLVGFFFAIFQGASLMSWAT